MNAICYFCNNRSTNWCRNFAEIKSRHTQTPIADFIRQFLGDFHSTRNIDDKSNYICNECLEQIDDYDWLKQQARKQESKLCALLLATETKLSGQSVGKNAFANMANAAEIKVEPDTDVTETCVQQSTPILSVPQPALAVPPPQSPILHSLCNQTPNVTMPTAQLTHKRTFVKIPKSAVEQKHFYIQQNGKPCKVIIANLGKTPNNSITGSQNGKDVVVLTKSAAAAAAATTKSKSIISPVYTLVSASAQHNSSRSRSTVFVEYPKPAISNVLLIALALKNSWSGLLLCTEICSFICAHFPYFKATAIDWQNFIRYSLYGSKHYFEHIQVTYADGDPRTRPLWSIKPSMMAEINKKIGVLFLISLSIRKAMTAPGNLPALLRGEMKHGTMYDVQFEAGSAQEPIVSTEEISQIDCNDDASNMFEDTEFLAEKPGTLDTDQGQTPSTSKRSRLDSLIDSILTPNSTNSSTADLTE